MPFRSTRPGCLPASMPRSPGRLRMPAAQRWQPCPGIGSWSRDPLRPARSSHSPLTGTTVATTINPPTVITNTRIGRGHTSARICAAPRSRRRSATTPSAFSPNWPKPSPRAWHRCGGRRLSRGRSLGLDRRYRGGGAPHRRAGRQRLERVGAAPRIGPGVHAARPAAGTAPATSLLLEGFATLDDGIPGERVTPTGRRSFAICAIWRPCPAARTPPHPRAVGHRFGTKVLPGISNCQRVLVYAEARPPSQGAGHRELGVIEFEVDDHRPRNWRWGSTACALIRTSSTSCRCRSSARRAG